MRLNYGIVITLGISACSPDIPNDNKLENVFNSHVQLFVDAEKICLSGEDVRSISIEKGVYILKTTKGSGELNPAAKAKISNLFSQTGVTQMKCLWVYSKGNGELFGTSFVAYSSGISVSGRTKSIEHILIKDESWQKEAAKRGELRKLLSNNWFIYEPQ